MDIDEESLLALLLPSAERLKDVKLDKLFLTNGSWASIYKIFLRALVAVIDISGIHGRRYCDDRSSYSREDAGSWKDFFAAVERRRTDAGLPSMKAIKQKGCLEYSHDFCDMETVF